MQCWREEASFRFQIFVAVLAMERLADAFGSMANPQIKAAKDMAAGAVLLLALTAAVLGLFLLLVILKGVV